MKFKVSRTSIFGDKKPCDGVTLEKFDYIERRSCSEEEFNKVLAKIEGLWRSKGINHTTFENEYSKGIQRTFPQDEEGWFIELNSLEDLIQFMNKVGKGIVLGKYWGNESIYEIEIYDAYRE